MRCNGVTLWQRSDINGNHEACEARDSLQGSEGRQLCNLQGQQGPGGQRASTTRTAKTRQHQHPNPPAVAPRP